MKPFNPYKFYLLTAIILSATIAAALWFYTSIAPLWIYLISISVITFSFYCYDKHQAIKQKNRIPELILHLLALAGGTPGALAGQLIFRHKTKKLKFKLIFITTAIIQAGLLLLWISYF